MLNRDGNYPVEWSKLAACFVLKNFTRVRALSLAKTCPKISCLHSRGFTVQWQIFYKVWHKIQNSCLQWICLLRETAFDVTKLPFLPKLQVFAVFVPLRSFWLCIMYIWQTSKSLKDGTQNLRPIATKGIYCTKKITTRVINNAFYSVFQEWLVTIHFYT